jgi:uncharacterized protein (TIGR02300 family)
MTRARMGEKRRCLSCNTAFFDLNRSPIICPKCAEVFQLIEPVRSSVGRSRAFQNRGRWTTPLSEPSTLDITESAAADANASAEGTDEKNSEIEVVEEGA